MISEETINNVLSLAKQKCRRRTDMRIKLFEIVFGSVCMGIAYGLYVWRYYNEIDTLAEAIVGIIPLLVIFPFVVINLWYYFRVEKMEYDDNKAILTNTGQNLYCSFYRRGNMLVEYGFYEEALDDFNSAFQEFEKKLEQIAESLPKFFEEYNAMTKFVNGIHRPVPDFRNHDLFRYSQHYQAQKNCLEKLERYDEAKSVEEKLKTIAILTEENNNLTEKYWKDFGCGDYE
ncbi:MAG: hypothetical protein LBC02_07305 [Planctomycetaceae bacterium]|jgi:tetratricopeptide (TPR) repeat protein|nr:hypothetical protein [Planctomycetaceae bacterium]